MAKEQLSLMKETLDLLQNRNESLPSISKNTGIPFFWLRKFKYGEIDDPSVNRVQKLWEYLSERKLRV